jgi:hypothetical protein
LGHRTRSNSDRNASRKEARCLLEEKDGKNQLPKFQRHMMAAASQRIFLPRVVLMRTGSYFTPGRQGQLGTVQIEQTKATAANAAAMVTTRLGDTATPPLTAFLSVVGPGVAAAAVVPGVTATSLFAVVAAAATPLTGVRVADEAHGTSDTDMQRPLAERVKAPPDVIKALSMAPESIAFVREAVAIETAALSLVVTCKYAKPEMARVTRSSLDGKGANGDSLGEP